MRLILDSNEYIFGLNEFSGQASAIRLVRMLPWLIAEVEEFVLFVPEIVRSEVQSNLARDSLDDFYRFVNSSPKIVFGSLYEVPTVVFQKYYRQLGLKVADAAIAAFADWVNADFLVSENRHIYQDLKVEKFITCSAEEFMSLLDSSEIWQVVDKLRAKMC